MCCGMQETFGWHSVSCLEKPIFQPVTMSYVSALKLAASSVPAALYHSGVSYRWDTESLKLLAFRKPQRLSCLPVPLPFHKRAGDGF